LHGTAFDAALQGQKRVSLRRSQEEEKEEPRRRKGK